MTSSFTNFSSFMHMGGYAAYVWPAYGIVVLVLGGQVLKIKQLTARLFVTQGCHSGRSEGSP